MSTLCYVLPEPISYLYFWILLNNFPVVLACHHAQYKGGLAILIMVFTSKSLSGSSISLQGISSHIANFRTRLDVPATVLFVVSYCIILGFT